MQKKGEAADSEISQAEQQRKGLLNIVLLLVRDVHVWFSPVGEARDAQSHANLSMLLTSGRRIIAVRIHYLIIAHSPLLKKQSCIQGCGQKVFVQLYSFSSSDLTQVNDTFIHSEKMTHTVATHINVNIY